MANKNIRGITVEIGGDTSKLGKALENSEKKSRSLNVELREIQNSLKFNPNSVELLTQKQTVLTQSIEETSDKLDVLKEAERQVIAQFERGEVAEEQVRALQREIIKTENQLESMKGELKSTTQYMSDLADGTQEAKERTAEYEKKLDEAEKELGEFGDKASEAFDTLKTGVLALGASAVAGAGYALTLSTEFDKAFNTIQTQTGATAEEMVGLEESMTEIYKLNLGENMEDIAKSMATVKTQTKLTGDELKDVTATALVMRDTFDFEVNESIRAVNSLMNQFGITADEAYTLIAQGAQKGLNQNDDLLDTINEYSVQFKMLGFSAEDMFNMLVNGASEGTWSVDKLGDAIKEFNIRAKDGSDSTATAFAQLGLTVGDSGEAINKAKEEISKYESQIEKLENNIKYAQIQQSEFNEKTSELTKVKTADNIASWSKELLGLKSGLEATTQNLANLEEISASGGQTTEELFARFAEGGESAKEATNEVLTALFAMEDKVAQDAVGVALFGTMWEDLGADAVKALLTTQGEISKTSDALDTINETKYDDIGSALEGLGRTIQTDLVDPIGEELKPVVEDAIEYVQDNGPQIREVLSNIATAVGDFVRMVIDNKDTIIATIVAIGAGMLTWNVVSMITSVIGAIKAFTTALSAGKTVMQALNLVMNANPIGIIITAVGALVAGFIYLWNNCEAFREFWIGLWEGIKSAISTAIDFVVGLFNKVVDFVKNNWQDILLFILNPFAFAFKYLYENFEGFRNFVDGIISAIVEFFVGLGTSIAEIATGIWTKIVEIFTPVVEWFSALFSSIYDTLASVIQVIVTLATGTWEVIKAVFAIVATWFNENVITPVANFFKNMWSGITTFASNAWTGIKNIFLKVSGWFNDTVIKPVAKFFSGMWDKLKSGASSAWTGIKNVFAKVGSFFSETFSKAWGKVKDIFSTGGKIFSGITEGITSMFKKVVNTIIKGINKVVAVPFNAINTALSAIRNIEIVGLKPFTSLPKISVPQIPQLYQGGILKKGQVGLLEGNGAEAVVPLEKETAWINRIAQKMNESTNGNQTVALANKMDEMIRTMKSLKQTIVLDTGTLVGETITQIDAGLGDIYSLRERGI